MITIWTKVKQDRALQHLAPVLRQVPQLPVRVVQDYSIPDGTKTIFALGGDSLKHLQETGAVAKNKSITSLRTLPVPFSSVQLIAPIPTLVSFNPDIGEIDHSHYINMLTDLTLAIRFVQTGVWKPQYGKYRYVQTFAELIDKIEKRHYTTGEAVDTTHDLETLGLDPWALPTLMPPYPGAYIVLMQATCTKGEADCIRFDSRAEEEHWLHEPAWLEQLDFLLNSPKVKLKGANLKYDMVWHRKRSGLRSKSFCFDTTMVGSLLDENRSNALNVHTKIYCPRLAGYDDEFNAKVDKSRMDKVPPEELLPYGGGDVDADLEVAEVQKQELLKDQKLARFYVNILHPASRVFEDIEYMGVLVDVPAMKQLQVELEAEHIALVKEAQKILGGRIVVKHRDPSKLGGMNLTKASMLCDYMFSPMGLDLTPQMFTAKPDKNGERKPSTAMEHLLMFEDDPDAKAFIDIIKRDGKLMKTHGTFVVGFMEHLRSDGRLHPTYFLYAGDREEDEGGTTTGRLSAKAPAFQTIPVHTADAPRIRRCYIAPPGYVIIGFDYAAGELRVAACIANERNMINAFLAGIDIHAKTAGPFRGYPYDAMMALKKADEELFGSIRQLGKAGNFGLLFKMQAPGFQIYARKNYGVELTLEEAEAFRDGFFTDYPALLDYHDEYESRAHKEKQVRSPLGRVRHLPLIDSPNKALVAQAERQAVNSPVQSTLSDMGLWALAECKKAGILEHAPCFGMVHDASYFYAPEDKAEALAKQIGDVMMNLPFEKVGWKPQLQFLADGKMGLNMADMKKLKM